MCGGWIDGCMFIDWLSPCHTSAPPPALEVCISHEVHHLHIRGTLSAHYSCLHRVASAQWHSWEPRRRSVLSPANSTVPQNAFPRAFRASSVARPWWRKAAVTVRQGGVYALVCVCEREGERNGGESEPVAHFPPPSFSSSSHPAGMLYTQAQSCLCCHMYFIQNIHIKELQLHCIKCRFLHLRNTGKISVPSPERVAFHCQGRNRWFIGERVRYPRRHKQHGKQWSN